MGRSRPVSSVRGLITALPSGLTQPAKQRFDRYRPRLEDGFTKSAKKVVRVSPPWRFQDRTASFDSVRPLELMENS